MIRRALAGEGLAVALAGAIGGAIVGIAYAWLMLVGLRTWWVAAISTPFVELKVSPMSLAVGLSSGCAASFAAILWALWRMRHVETRRLLSGERRDEPVPVKLSAKRWSRFVFFERGDMIAYIDFLDRSTWGGIALFGAVLALGGWFLEGEVAGRDVLRLGVLVLIGLLLILNGRLRSNEGEGIASPSSAARLVLARRNIGRNPIRSTLTIGLVAAAAFLLIAISAFRLEPPEPGVRTSGTGGFSLIAESDQPIYEDLRPIAERLNADMGKNGKANESPLPAHGVSIYPLRLRPGDDASCLNLYQAQQPQLLGVTSDFIHRGGFAWTKTAADNDATKSNPWLLLDQDFGESADGRQIIPMILDANTATYSLHLNGLGAIYELPDDSGGTIPLQIVGLLKNSVLQGSLIVSEKSAAAGVPRRERLSGVLGRCDCRTDIRGCLAVGRNTRRLRLCRRADVHSPGRVHGRAKYLSRDVPDARRPGVAAGNSGDRGGPVAKRV